MGGGLASSAAGSMSSGGRRPCLPCHSFLSHPTHPCGPHAHRVHCRGATWHRVILYKPVPVALRQQLGNFGRSSGCGRCGDTACGVVQVTQPQVPGSLCRRRGGRRRRPGIGPGRRRPGPWARRPRARGWRPGSRWRRPGPGGSRPGSRRGWFGARWARARGGRAAYRRWRRRLPKHRSCSKARRRCRDQTQCRPVIHTGRQGLHERTAAQNCAPACAGSRARRQKAASSSALIVLGCPCAARRACSSDLRALGGPADRPPAARTL